MAMQSNPYLRRDESPNGDPSLGPARRGMSGQVSIRPAPEHAAVHERQRVLIIDEDQVSRRAVATYLTRIGDDVDVAEDVHGALVRLGAASYDLILCDVRVSRGDNGALADALRARCEETAVVLMSAFATVENVASAMSNGVYDYLLKPVEPQHLAALCVRVQRHRAARRSVTALRAALAARDGLAGVLAGGPSMASVQAAVRKAAATTGPVFIHGEPGAGKAALARAIHGLSARAEGPVEVVDCARDEVSLVRDLLGVVGDGGVKVRAARGGTLILESVTSVPQGLRARLVQALAAADGVRVIAISADPPPPASRREGRGRLELFTWLRAVEIHVPPLREHREDVPRLVEHFASLARGPSAPPVRVAPDVMAALITAPWKGNVRELESVVREALAAAGNAAMITREHLPEALRPPASGGSSLTEQVEAHERAVLRHALESVQGQVGRAARVLGVPERTLRRKMRYFGIAKEAFRKRTRARKAH